MEINTKPSPTGTPDTADGTAGDTSDPGYDRLDPGYDRLDPGKTTVEGWLTVPDDEKKGTTSPLRSLDQQSPFRPFQPPAPTFLVVSLVFALTTYVTGLDSPLRLIGSDGMLLQDMPVDRGRFHIHGEKTGS